MPSPQMSRHPSVRPHFVSEADPGNPGWIFFNIAHTHHLGGVYLP